MSIKKTSLSSEEKRQLEFDHLIEFAEETIETQKNAKNSDASILFGHEVHAIEKGLENFGKK